MITNEYTVTKQLYMKWFREGQKKGVQLRITIMWACIIIVLLISAIVFFNISTADPTTPSDVRPWLLVEAAFVLYSIYHLFFRRKIAASNMYDKMAVQFGENWTKTLDFRDDALYDIQGNLEIKYPYSEIESVHNVGDEILMVTDKKVTIRVYKDKFVQGDYARFKRFIESKVVNKCFLN